MILDGARVSLEPISPQLARRIVAREERPGDRWHPEYPFVDELGPLRALAASPDQDPFFTMYLIRRVSDRLAVGGFGFFGPPDAAGRVEFGYGLVPSARGDGLASDAVTVALRHAAVAGATLAAADTDTSNIPSRCVLAGAGFVEVERRGSLVFFERRLSLP